MVAQRSGSSHGSSHHQEIRPVNSPSRGTGTVQRCYDDLRHPIHTIVEELVDPSSCTRRSALGKLQCALSSDILNTCDPEKDTKPLLRSLLEWFNLPSPSHEILVLSLLSRLAQDDENHKLLIDLGAVEFMEQYRADCCHTILPYTTSLLHILCKQNPKMVGETVRSVYLHDTGRGYVVPTTQHPVQASRAGQCKNNRSVCNMTGDQNRCKEQVCTSSDSYIGDCQAKGKPCPLIRDILERNEQLKDRKTGLYSDSNCDSLPCGEMSRWPPSRSRTGSPASAACTEQVANQSCQPWPSNESQEKPTVPKRLNSPRETSESHKFSDPSNTDALQPILPCIWLEESDDKYLFNLNVTLQYLDDREVLLAALKELREAVVFDFHPQAILQKYSIMQNAFVLLQKIADSDLEHMVFDFLLELVRQIKAALKLSSEAGFQVHLDSESLQGMQEFGGSAHGKSKLDLKCSYPVYIKLSAHTAVDSGKAVHLLAGLKLDSKGTIQPVILLGHTLHIVALQLISLLVNERHRDMSFAILHDLLPLLKPPTDKSLDDKVPVQFAQYFHALCEVLQALNGRSEDLETLCTDITGKHNFDKSAHHCSPLLRVLSFTTELLCLLQPSRVAGLLPCALVKALITLAGDLILAKCTFGMHKNIFPYLKYLDPAFLKSYTCATESAFTLHVLVKELALSEETAAQWNAKRQKGPVKTNTEMLLKCMIQAVPNYAYFNHKYLVPRVVHIIPDVLRIELVKACQGSVNCHTDTQQSNIRIQPSRHNSVEGVISQARSLIYLLLSHTSAPVRQVAYDSLLEVSSKEKRQAQQHIHSRPKLASEREETFTVGNTRICIHSDEPDCLLHHTNGSLRPLSVLHRLLIFGTSIMGEIITVGLHDTATCKQSVLLLQHMVEELSEMERAQIIPGYPWIACCAYLSPELVPIVEQLHSVLFPAKPSPQKECSPHNQSGFCTEWAQLSCILRSLFSSCISDRCRGSIELVKILRQWYISEDSVCWWLRKLKRSESHSNGIWERSYDMLLDNPFQFLKDPFQQCLKYKEATLFSFAFGSSIQDIKKRENVGVPLDGQKKVEDLLSMFKSASVGETIRKAAVEHLTWLIQDQSLRALVENDEELLKDLIAEIVDWMRKTDMHFEECVEITSNRCRLRSPVRMDSSDTNPTDLGIACLSFLARLAPASALGGEPSLRDMLIRNSCKILWLLIPLVFHPFECVRKDMALLLAFTLFSSDVLFRGLNEMISEHAPTHHLVPTIGKTLGSLHSIGKDIQIAVPFPFIGGHCFPCQVVSVAVKLPVQSSAESPVDEQLVHRIIAQSVLLQGGYENLLHSIESRVVSDGGPLRTIELQAMACLSVLHADITIKKLLKLLTDPQLCCGMEIQFLDELEAQCLRHPQAAKMLARASWVLTFQRFLTRIPSTPEESTQLLKVLKLVQIIINSKSAGSSNLLFLTTVSKQILMPILSKSPTPRLGSNLHHAIVLIEGYPADDMDFTILRLFVDMLLGSKGHEDASLFGHIAAGLAKGTSLLSVLLSKFVKSPSAPYLCCVLAVQCLSLIAKGIAAALDSNGCQLAVKRTGYLQDKEISSEDSLDQGDTGPRNSHAETEMLHQELEILEDQGEYLWTTIGDELVEVVLPLIKHMAHLHSHHYLSLRHKRLVREIVSCLWSITSCVPPYLWEDLWSSTGITYWLSRLLDDQEATVRGMGFGILAILASPATPKTRALLEQNWPELGDAAVHTVLNTQECYAVREEALRFLISVTVWSGARRTQGATAEKNSVPTGFERIDSLGVNDALQRYKFWMLFPTLLQERDGTSGFCRVLLELTLKLTISDLGFVTRILSLNPQVFNALMEHLESGTARERRSAPKCLHTSDFHGAKAYVGEILCILAQQEDAHIQCLIQNQSVVEKLVCALSYCLGCQKLESPAGDASTKFVRTNGQAMVECYYAHNLYSLMEHERIEAIFYVSEALNLVVCQMLQAATQQPNRADNHIRVDDILSFNLREGNPEVPGRGALSFQAGIQTFLGEIVGKSGICRDISCILSKVPLMKDLQSAGKTDSRRIRSVSLKRMQLAVCALVGTLLSDDSLANAIFENDRESACENASDGSHVKASHLVPILHNSFLLIMADVHELGRQPKISRDGDILISLHTMLFTVGGALQNLISVSAQAKDFAVESDLPSRLMGYAYEAYALLGCCGLAPMRNILTTSLTGSTNQRSKRRNMAPKVVNQLIRPSIWSRKTKQGKLSDHHRSLLLGELIIYFRLLKNLVFENPATAEQSGNERLFDFIRLVWGYSLSEEDLLHEILGLLCNLAAQSDAAKEAMACQTQICQGGKGGSLMDYAAAIVLRLPSNQLSYTLAVGLLQILVTMAKARAIFLRKQYLSEFLQHYGQNVHSNDVLRQHLILQLLINLSVFPNGQKMLSKGLSDGSMLDLVLDTIEQTHYIPASSSALFLLRNLAFCRETRFFFLCNERTLPLLVESLGSSSLEARANAASALWILTSTERRISSVLKKIDAFPSLVAAHEGSKLHLKIFQTHVHKIANEQGGMLTGRCAAAVSKMGKFVTHIEQSLFAVNQLIGGMHEYD